MATLEVVPVRGFAGEWCVRDAEAILLFAERHGLPLLIKAGGYPEESLRVDGRPFRDAERIVVSAQVAVETTAAGTRRWYHTVTVDRIGAQQHGSCPTVTIARYHQLAIPTGPEALPAILALTEHDITAAAQRDPHAEQRTAWEQVGVLDRYPGALTRDAYEAACAACGVTAEPDAELARYSVRYGEFAWPEYPVATVIAMGLAKRRLAALLQERAAVPRPSAPAAELVTADCGHTINRALLMSASRGRVCPDCYDTWSD